MGIAREMLLRGSESAWLADQLTRRRFLRRAVTRFMPGETLDAATEAAAALHAEGITAILTLLGENVADRDAAREVLGEYRGVLRRLAGTDFDADISVKPTHLGLDAGPDEALRNIGSLVGQAAELGRSVAIDMEASAYVDRTLALYRRLREERTNVSVCLQSYLYRTPDDVRNLLPLEPTIRLVKGAYKEPAGVAWPRKRDVDAAYLRLAGVLLQAIARGSGARTAFGTHDTRLIEAINRRAESMGLPRDAYEFQFLYGIQREAQSLLARAGYSVRVLISYGPHWFPWYMRRLAERPANVGFVLRNLVG